MTARCSRPEACTPAPRECVRSRRGSTRADRPRPRRRSAAGSATRCPWSPRRRQCLRSPRGVRGRSERLHENRRCQQLGAGFLGRDRERHGSVLAEHCEENLTVLCRGMPRRTSRATRRSEENLSILVDIFSAADHLLIMTAGEVISRLVAHGCREVRQSGSHRRFESGSGHCKTTVPDHGRKQLGRGLVRAIERDMEHCLGKGWLR